MQPCAASAVQCSGQSQINGILMANLDLFIIKNMGKKIPDGIYYYYLDQNRVSFPRLKNFRAGQPSILNPIFLT